MENSKVCESAYLAAPDVQHGCHLHGAGMMLRAAGKTHYFLVRGTSKDSVVRTLHNQLIKTGRLPKSSIKRAPSNSRIRRSNSKRSGSTTIAPLVATVIAGLIATLVGLIRVR